MSVPLVRWPSSKRTRGFKAAGHVSPRHGTPRLALSLLILHFLIAHQLLDCYMTSTDPLLCPLQLASPLHVLIYLVNCILFHFPALLTIFCCHFISTSAVKVAQLCCLPSRKKVHIGMLQVDSSGPPSSSFFSCSSL